SESMDLDFLAGYGVASLAAFAVGMIVYRRFRNGSVTESSMAGLGASSSNSGFVGVSICAMVLGTAPASRAVAMTILVESMIMVPMAMAIADAGANQSGARLGARLRHTIR